MSDTTLHDQVQYVQAVHCQQHHGGHLQVQPGCATCLALSHAAYHATPHPLQTTRIVQKVRTATPTRGRR
jgi:hypothetical protein